ncbi:MAG: TldD/PmbA family protein [Gemmatimonadales bacterium]
MAGILTRDEARALSERILGASKTDAAQVVLRSTLDGHTRYALNQLTTSGEAEDTNVSLTVRIGRRSASVSFNSLETDAIRAAVADAARLAALTPEDPELMPLLTPQEYAAAEGYFESTATLDAARRADAVGEVVASAGRGKVVATGFLQRRAGAVAVANTAGLFAYHRATQVSHTTTARTPDGEGSGWAGTTHNDYERTVEPRDLAERAVEKAVRSRGRGALEPGSYTVVLEPTAVGNLIRLLRFSLDARQADEGRSYFSRQDGGNRIGERVASELVTLLSDPADPDLLTEPFTEDGEALRRTVWIENGELRNLSYSRYWAERAGREPTPPGGGLKFIGGEGSVGDLVSTVDRGVLVTRFWYIRSIEARSMSFTGLTRDGTFLIEDGRPTAPVTNMRFNESVMAMLNNIVKVGESRRVVASESGGLGEPVVAPPLVVRDFHFTSVSDAV